MASLRGNSLCVRKNYSYALKTNYSCKSLVQSSAISSKISMTNIR